MITAQAKFLALLFAVLALFGGAAAHAQGVPLRSGSYRCFIASPGAIGPDSSPRDPAWRRAHGMPELEPGQRATPPMQAPQIMITPAFFGNIVVDGKGGYRLTGSGHVGRYSFNQRAGVPTFTGDLSVMKVAQYDGGRGHFFLVYQSLAFECGLEGRPTATPALQAAPPSTRNGTAADYTGHFEGSYVCNSIAKSMQIDLKASANGALVGIYRSNEGDGESYSLVGRWTPSGFSLSPNAWIHQPAPQFEMIGMEGRLTTNGLTGTYKHPRCTTFDLRKQ